MSKEMRLGGRQAWELEEGLGLGHGVRRWRNRNERDEDGGLGDFRNQLRWQGSVGIGEIIGF